MSTDIGVVEVVGVFRVSWGLEEVVREAGILVS